VSDWILSVGVGCFGVFIGVGSTARNVTAQCNSTPFLGTYEALFLSRYVHFTSTLTPLSSLPYAYPSILFQTIDYSSSPKSIFSISIPISSLHIKLFASHIILPLPCNHRSTSPPAQSSTHTPTPVSTVESMMILTAFQSTSSPIVLPYLWLRTTPATALMHFLLTGSVLSAFVISVIVMKSTCSEVILSAV
jgi:hypothetical protein